MPALVLVGAQWGDEGKGKATDQLGGSRRLRREVQRRQQRRPHRRHRRRDVRAAPAAQRHPSRRAARRSSATASSSTCRCCSRRSTRLEARGVSLREAACCQRRRAPHRRPTTARSTASPSASSARRRSAPPGRGIGPTYADKMNRIGIRVQDLFDEGILRQKVEGALATKNQVLAKVYNRKAVAVDEVVEELLAYADRVRPMVADTSLLLNQALDRGETVLLEGGQATLLDVDHGTYPFVTSSSATAGGACTGSGIGPRRVDKVIAVVKAYTTRVGEGPFPTELLRRRRRAAARRRPRVRHDHRAPAPLRLVRRRHRPLRRARQRRHRLRAHQARRAHRLGEDPGVRRLRGRRPALRRDADEPDRLPPRDAGLRAARRLDRGHQRRPHLRGPAEERAAVRAGARADERRAVQRASASGPTASRRSSCGPCCRDPGAG